MNCFLSDIVLFVFFLSGVLRPTQELFHSYEIVHVTGEGLQISTYTWHSGRLSNGMSLVCHTHYATGQTFIMVSSEDQGHSHL